MKILYRVVAALSALLIIPALWFLKTLHVMIELPTFIFDAEFSLSEIYENFLKDESLSSIQNLKISEELAAVLAPLKTPSIITAVFFVLMILFMLAVLICSAFTNSRKLNLALSLAGAASTIGLMTSFKKTTSLIIDGTVGLDKIINALVAESESTIIRLLSFFTGGIGNAVTSITKPLMFQLTDGTMAVLFIFIFIALWTGAFMLIEMDEYGTPKAKQKKQHSKNHPKKKHN